MQADKHVKQSLSKKQECLASGAENQQFAVPTIEQAHFDARDLMTLPDEVVQSIERYKVALRGYVKENGRLPSSPQELIDYTQGTLTDMDVLAWEAYGKPISLDLVICFEGFETPLENFVPDSSSIEDHAFDYLYDALDSLPEKERKVIESRFVLYDDVPDSKDLVSSWGISSRQVDKLLQSGLSRLAQILRPNHAERSQK